MTTQEEQREKEWKARDDAHTLAEAENIKTDKARISAAQNAARKMVKEQEDKTKALKSVASKPKQAAKPRQAAKSKIVTRSNTKTGKR